MKRLVFIMVFLLSTAWLAWAGMPVSTGLGQYPLLGSAPVRIAAGPDGRLYVADTFYGAVYVLSNNGVMVGSFGMERPTGIAVAGDGRVFIGSAKGGISVYGPSGEFLRSFGQDIGVNDLAVSNAGVLYATDNPGHKAVAYDLDGKRLFSFGLFGSPTGIAVDSASGEVYVVDAASIKVKVYNLSGGWKRDLSVGGTTFKAGAVLRPDGIASDAQRLYIADAYHSVIAVYTKTGSFLGYIGGYGSEQGRFRIPADVALDSAGKLFVADMNNQRVGGFGLDSYTELKVQPDEASFSLFEGGLPATAEVGLSSNIPLEWTSSVSSGWVSVPASGTTPQTVGVTVNPAGLLPGVYTAFVNFTTDGGTASVLKVVLEVKGSSASLSVTPKEMAFKYQLENPEFPSGALLLTSTGMSLSWTAAASTPWITLEPASGVTPASIKLSLNGELNTLEPGSYAGNVTVNAGAAVGSPAEVKVDVRVIYAGTVEVKTNMEGAIFTLSGPSTYTGSGTLWSYDEVTPGTYTVSFNHISGYLKPYTRTFTVKTGRTVTIDGDYRQKPVATHIIAGMGTPENQGVSVITPDGLYRTSAFVPPIKYDPNEGIRVHAGDLDGNGIDEIVLGSRDDEVSVYTHEGAQVTALGLPPEYKNVELALGDIDHDGAAELVLGYQNQDEYKGRRFAVYEYEDGELKEKALLYEEAGKVSEDYAFGLGDIDGDGLLEMVIADEGSLRAFDISEELKASPLWGVTNPGGMEFDGGMQVALGDLDDDGLYEIAVALMPPDAGNGKKKGEAESKGGIIRLYKGTGEPYGLELDAFGDLGYEGVPSVALGDVDGDSKDELLTGAAVDRQNSPLIRLFDADGTLLLTIKAGEGKGGVNACTGRLK